MNKRLFLTPVLILLIIGNLAFNKIYDNFLAIEIDTNFAANQLSDESNYAQNKFIAKGGVREIINLIFLSFEVIIFCYLSMSIYRNVKRRKN